MVDLEALEDRALVSQTQEGNRDAFSVLVTRYQDRVLNLAFRRLGDRDAALDVAQEVFLKAYRGLSRFQGQAQFFTWLYRIALNETATAHRQRRRHPTPASLDQENADGERGPDPADGGVDPSTAVERKDDQVAVQRAIGELEEDHYHVIVMRDLDGLSYQEVAEVLEVPVGSVKSRIHRARQALKNRLSKVIEPN